MSKWFFLLALLWVAPAHAQNTTCATRPSTDSSNACASTAFVNNFINTFLPWSVPNGGTGDTTFTTGLPLIGNGTGAIAQGTVSGTTTKFPVVDGTTTNGQCAVWDASGGLSSVACSPSGSGTVGSGVVGQIAVYTGSTAVAGAYQTITKNLLPNTQWQIYTVGGAEITKVNSGGTGVQSTVSISSNTYGAVQPVVLSTSNTQQFKVGDIIGALQNGQGLNYAPMRITALTTNTSFTVYTPGGNASFTPTTTYTNTATALGVGDLAGTSPYAPDPWTKTTTILMWRDDFSANAKSGSVYSLGMKKGASGTETVTYTSPPTQVSEIAGRTVTFGAWVLSRANVGNGNFKLCINAVCSSATGGTNAYQWVEVSTTVASNATTTNVSLSLQGSSGDIYYLSQPIEVIGSYIGTGNYVQNKGEVLQFSNHANPLAVPLMLGTPGSFPSTNWPGAAGIYGFEWDIEAITYGQIARTVQFVGTQLEYTSATPNYNAQMGTCMCSPGAIFGLEAFTQVANITNGSSGNLPIDTTGLYISGQPGYFAIYTGYVGGLFSNITLDFSYATLN